MRLVLFVTATIAERQSARARLRRYPTLLRDGACPRAGTILATARQSDQ
jgi:hypothetical protein